MSQQALPTAGDPEKAPPRLGLLDMAKLALRTWPYFRPMLKHLLVVLAFTFAGWLAAVPSLFIGTDLFTNKVLLGEKLQPLQAVVLLVGDEYVKDETGAEPTTDVDTESAPDAVTDGLTQEQRTVVRNRLIVWMVIAGIGGGIYFAVFSYYNMWVWQSINQNLRLAIVQRAESLSLGFHDNARVGDAVFRIYQDSAMIVNVIQSGILGPLYLLASLAIGLGVVAVFDPWFALLVLLVTLPVGWLIVAIAPGIRRRALANRSANADLVSRTQESFSALKVVKASRAEQAVLGRFRADSRRALDAAFALRASIAAALLLVAMLGGVMVVLSELLMVRWIVEERATYFGAFVAGIIGFGIWNYGAYQIASGRVVGVSDGLRGLLNTWMLMQDLFIGLRRAFFLLDIEPGVDEPAEPAAFPAPIERVTWQSVRFRYPPPDPDSGQAGDNDRSQGWVLDGVSLEARVGTVTAIVGATGAGKSTMMSLLLRLYSPATGQLAVNDVALDCVRTEEVRRHIAIALQKNVLFADTVRNNIRYGAPSAVTDEQTERAARVACADEFIRAMPHGYATELGERGGKLSAGQRQRLSIARAVVRDAPVLILDEPTASLDARTERQVLANLAEWGKGRVIFLITHRISTIRQADQIAFLENGRIAEVGTHDELATLPDGRYRAFVEAELDAGRDSRSAAHG